MSACDNARCEFSMRDLFEWPALTSEMQVDDHRGRYWVVFQLTRQDTPPGWECKGASSLRARLVWLPTLCL